MTVVHMQLVVHANLTSIAPNEESNPLPAGLNERLTEEAIRKNAMRIRADDGEIILEELNRCQMHDLDEEHRPKNRP